MQLEVMINECNWIYFYSKTSCNLIVTISSNDGLTNVEYTSTMLTFYLILQIIATQVMKMWMYNG